MISFIKTSANWQDIQNVCRVTIGRDESDRQVSKAFKYKLLLSEHSPIRMLTITWLWTAIPSWVSVHFVRHKIGIEHFVESQREDRNGKDRNAKRQDAQVNHACFANAQAIINISKKRLCKKASKETAAAWRQFLDALSEVEPELESVCVRECVYRNGVCPEISSCGFTKTDEFVDELKKYKNLFEKYREDV